MSHERLNPDTLPPPEPGLNSQIVRYRPGVGVRFSGVVALDERGHLVGENDMRAQVRQVYENISAALHFVEMTWADVTHLTVYTTDVGAYMSIESEIVLPLVRHCPPASTVVEVRRLIDPRWMVEVQVDASQELSDIGIQR